MLKVLALYIIIITSSYNTNAFPIQYKLFDDAKNTNVLHQHALT